MQVASKVGTFLPNLGMLGLWVLELFALYATDRQTDGRTDKSNVYCPLRYSGGGITNKYLSKINQNLLHCLCCPMSCLLWPYKGLVLASECMVLSFALVLKGEAFALAISLVCDLIKLMSKSQHKFCCSCQHSQHCIVVYQLT